MLNAVAAIGQIGVPPMPQIIELNIFVQQFSNCDKLFLYIDIFIQLDLGGDADDLWIFHTQFPHSGVSRLHNLENAHE